MFFVVMTGMEELKPLAQYCQSTVAWLPVMNPLATVLFIKSYRRGFVDFLKNASMTNLCRAGARTEPLESQTASGLTRQASQAAQ